MTTSRLWSGVPTSAVTLAAFEILKCYHHGRVNSQGQLVTFSDHSPTGEAEWVKHRISKALQSPIQQACPHPMLLTCDDFLHSSVHLHHPKAPGGIGSRDRLRRAVELVTMGTQ